MPDEPNLACMLPLDIFIPSVEPVVALGDWKSGGEIFAQGIGQMKHRSGLRICKPKPTVCIGEPETSSPDVGKSWKHVTRIKSFKSGSYGIRHVAAIESRDDIPWMGI